VLWEGFHRERRIAWSDSQVGINGIEFGNSVPTVFLPDGGFYGLSTSPSFPGREPMAPLPGDSNSDGLVDGDDLLLAVLGFGTAAGPTLMSGDADRDGNVDRADLALWWDNAGGAVNAATGVAGVPEPSSMVLAGWVGLAVFVAHSIAKPRGRRQESL
jgi:hypothetical protein